MLNSLLSRVIRTGRVEVRYAGGLVRNYGAVPCDARHLDVAVALPRRETAGRIAFDPWLALGEAYMDGDLIIERGGLWDLLEIFGQNLKNLPPPPPWLKVAKTLIEGFSTLNGLKASRRNVAHHYDLSDELYRTFLDSDRQYSCAYFTRPGMTLEEAQTAKKRHLIAKLDIRPGHKVLDIGCGWGGLALDIAKAANVEVMGITLSQEQLTVARQRAAAAGMEDRVRFELRDYRELEGRFDRIVSVGMFEHVGPRNFETYFRHVRDLLTGDGVAVIHTIGRRSSRGATNAWVRKYVFPGGYIPSLSEVTLAIERASFWITDVEILRLHYAETLRAWRERFMAHREEVAARYDERFCRMWEFYLASCEMCFRYGNLMVSQIQLAKCVDSLPLTRDYMFQREQEISRQKFTSLCS